MRVPVQAHPTVHQVQHPVPTPLSPSRIAPLPPISHIPPPTHPKVNRRSIEASQIAPIYGNNSFPEAPPPTVVPHLKGLVDYEYMAVLGRGHFGKVSISIINNYLIFKLHKHLQFVLPCAFKGTVAPEEVGQGQKVTN